MACVSCGASHLPEVACPISGSGGDALSGGTRLMASGAASLPRPEPLPSSAQTLPPSSPATLPDGTLVREAAPTPAGVTPPPPPLHGDEDPLLGTTVGSFRIVRRLGKGGMGTVYLGEQTVIGSKVAVKFLHEALATNPGLVSRFYAEARAVNLIGHENIVNIFDMNVVPPSRYYLIMEFLEGRTLAQLTHAAVPPEIAIPILSQICDALHAAHANGVVHRDLKPENVFLVKRGRNENFVKLVDFGIAKLFADTTSEQTSAGMIIGTPEYMAPEQASAERVDGRADIYALGVIAYQLATGRLPFSGGGLTGLLIAHREKPAPDPRELNAALPPAWVKVIAKALEKRPEDRFQNADEMREALDLALDAYLTRPRQPPPVIPTPTPASNLLAGTPHPAASRHAAEFPARVRTMSGQELGELQAQDISRGGLFLVSSVLPPVFTRVVMSLQIPGGIFDCIGEVVRHVTVEQARAWNMSPGFGVQFSDTSPAFKDAVGRIVSGLPPAKAAQPTPAPAKVASDDLQATVVLDFYRKRINGDHYAILSVMQDSDFAEIRSRIRDALRELEDVKARPLSDKQRGQLTTILDKLKGAQEALGTPRARAEFDGLKGNFRGVARCIANGLTVTELEQIRARVLAQRPTHDSRAQIAFATGSAWENKGQHAAALEQYEQALTLDSLNLRYHQRYWGLKKRPPPSRA